MSHSCYSSCTVGALSWRVELVTGSEGASWQCVETAVRRCVVEEGFLAASQLLLGAVCSDEAPKDLAALANSAPRPVAPGATARRAGGCGLCPGSHLGVHALVTPLLTDMYQITMAYSYCEPPRELLPQLMIVRRLPSSRFSHRAMRRVQREAR